jgi:N-methylhydantoinase B
MDPALSTIIANRLETITRQMINTLLRTARSGVLNTARDFSCAILTNDNQLLTFAESLPVHIGGISFEGETMVELHGRSLRSGDAYLNNSPYHGGTHHGDHTVLVPVFVDDKHVMTACAKAHQADIGNSVPTTYFPEAEDIYHEGAINLPCIKVQESYRDIQDIIRMCRMRIRVPEQWYGDYLAGIAAARIAELGIHALYEKYGSNVIDEFVPDWFDYSESRVRSVIRRLPEGRWTGGTRHDPFPGAPEGVPINIVVDVDHQEETVTIDLRDNIDCLPCGLNLSRATATAGALMGFFGALDETVPLNAGSLRRIDVKLRENCAIGIPIHPTSCSAATTNVFDRLVNVVWATMAKLGPEWGQAEAGLGMPASYAVISGRDHRRGDRPYINQLFLGATCGAGTPAGDAWLTFSMPADVGLAFRDSIEVDEQKYPILVYRNELIPDSEGAGKFRGAPAAVTELGPSGEHPMVAVYPNDGHEFPAQGVRGGGPGGPSDVFRIDADGTVSQLPQVGLVEIAPGERLRSICCGGGGYGNPKERDANAIAHDVEEEIVSLKRAAEVYAWKGAEAKAGREQEA